MDNSIVLNTANLISEQKTLFKINGHGNQAKQYQRFGNILN